MTAAALWLIDNWLWLAIPLMASAIAATIIELCADVFVRRRR
jgi:hypothetical protein